MPKRLCPFNASYPQIKTHVDMRLVGKDVYAKEVYDKTTKMLMEGAAQVKNELKKASESKDKGQTESRGKKNIGPVFKVLKENSACYYCRHKKNLISSQMNSCSYCNKTMCSQNCSRGCGSCGLLFCPSCYTIAYEEYEERVLCVTCCNNYMS